MSEDDDQESGQRCARGTRCAGRQPSTDGQRWIPAHTDRPLCDWCENATIDALADAPALYVDLRNAALHRGGNTALTERVTTSPGRSFGLNAQPLWLSEQLHWVLCAWADAVIDTAGRPSPDRTGQSEGQQLDDACMLLRTYFPVWLAHQLVEFQVTRENRDPDDPKAEPTDDTVTVVQAGWEACAWLLNWHEHAETVLKKRPLTHHIPEPCPACNVPRVLKRRDGADKVECTNCGKKWTLAMYETFVHAWIGAA